MKKRLCLHAVLIAAVALVVASCGDPTILLGRQISGSLKADDNYWVNHDQYGHATDAGYSDRYQVEVSDGTSYTVTLWTSTGNGAFEDKEGGRFYYSGGGSGTFMAPFPSNSVTATWIPAKTGLNAVDVYCFEGQEPIDYTILISEP
jgi:hypothetical protein